MGHALTEFDNMKAATQRYYDDALSRFGDGPEAVNWSSRETQELRFEMLCGVGKLANARVHDVGCGLGHMVDYLSVVAPVCDYVGSDISSKMVSAAKQRLGPDAELRQADIMTSDEEWMKADFVVNSGVFTVRGETVPDEWWQFVSKMVRRMFELCRTGIAFNLLTSYVDYQDDHLFYKAPAETLDFCIRDLSRRAVIRHDYPLWEYTVYLYR